MPTIGPWTIQIYAAMAIASLLYGYFIYRRIGLVAGLLVAYILSNGFYHAVLPKFEMPHLAKSTVQTFALLSFHGAVWLLCLLPFVFVNKKFLKVMVYVFFALGVVDCISIFFKLGLDNFQNSGFMLNPAQDGGYLACILPLALFMNHKIKWLLIPLFVAGIIACGATTPFVALAVVIGLYAWFQSPKYRLAFSVLATAIVTLMAIMYLGIVDYANPSGRVEVWRDSMVYWWSSVNIWFGSGPGTYFIIGPVLQLNASGFDVTTRVWAWMHNEWLQVLFEAGIIGFVLFNMFAVETLWKSYKRPVLFTCLSAYGVTLLTQMPFHNFLTSFFGAFLVAAIYLPEDINE